MASSSGRGPLCPDWVFSNTSNVHMSNDRRWFTSYTPFSSRAGSIYSNEENLPVAGVGTVILPVKKSSHRTGSGAHGQLVLHDVLHCPSARCNILGFPQEMRRDYKISFGGNGKSKGSIQDKEGNHVAYFDPKMKLFEVKLSGPPVGPVVGPSVLMDGMFMINIRWSEMEQQRWIAYKQNQGNPNKRTRDAESKNKNIQPSNDKARYTDEEKNWLKTHFKNEYNFLRHHGLSIYKDEDREEGREIVRSLMSEDDKEMNSASDEDHQYGLASDNDEEEGESESDLEGHMADYHFDEKSLDWIEKHYGNSMKFMFSHGLKFYNNDDCAEAQTIVHAMMEDDD